MSRERSFYTLTDTYELKNVFSLCAYGTDFMEQNSTITSKHLQR